jgi:7-carboxy-7-deazaguanine synthase
MSNEKIHLTPDGVFHTIQGEGIHAGLPTVFIRTSGCNLRCKWESGNICDTPYSSFVPERTVNTIDQIIQKVKALTEEPKHFCITGGEPLMQRVPVSFLIRKLLDTFLGTESICIETNGTFSFEDIPDREDITLSISPKLGSASASVKQCKEVLKNVDTLLLSNRFRSLQFKFVVSNETSLTEVQSFISDSGIDLTDCVFMPEGVTSEEIRERSIWLTEICKTLGVRFSDRLHIHLWERQRDK